MPQIKRFSGFKLLMFFQDENPRMCTSKALISRQRCASPTAA